MTAILGHPDLTVEHRAGGVQLDGCGQHQKDRAEQHQHQGRDGHVEAALQQKAAPAFGKNVVIGPDVIGPEKIGKVFPGLQDHKYSFRMST